LLLLVEYPESMDEKQLYQQLLGIAAPWEVERVELDVEKEVVSVHVVCARIGVAFACPECKRQCSCYDAREERRWRHLDSCGFSTYLVARLPRVECAEHGVKTVEAPWSTPHSRFTLAFECFALSVLQATKVQSRAAELLRLSPAQVHDLMGRAVERGMGRRDETQEVRNASIDEKSMHRGHSYITVLGDVEGRRVLEISKDRTLESTSALLRAALTPVQREGVRAVAMDFWMAFMQARVEVLPNAETVHDRFHIAQYLNLAVDLTRRSEHRELARKGESLLTKTKYLWLKNPDNLTAKQEATFEALRDSELMTAKVWAFKETFRDFFTLTTVGRGKTFLDKWIKTAVKLGNPHLTKVAEMFDRHREGLLAYLNHRISNGMAESFNSHIQEIKAVAHGFRTFESFRIAILFFSGKLDLYPQKSP